MDYGKGNGKASTQLPRTRISVDKFTGHCGAWKGKYGWIVPGEPIDHPLAHLHNGSLFVGQNEVEGGVLTEGAPCEFHIWEDETGLGAEEVIEIGPPPKGFVGKSGAKGGAAKGYVPYIPAYPVASAGNGWSAPSYGKGGWGAISPVINTYAKGPSGTGKGKFDKGMGKGTGGHKLPRTRISVEKFTGTVSAWKGKYGWITPAEEISHEMASKHNGGLFCSINDVEGGEALTEGATVEFHIWEDATGLGAEDVIQS